MENSNEFIDFYSGNLAGFIGGTADTIRLKIRKSDIEKANPILKEFLSSEDIN